jgi:cytochrome o ubiquinol oxidase subunit II
MLDRAAYLQLEKPSENEPVRRYASVDPGLFNAILNMCVEQGKMCMNEMAAIDARGGLGLAAANNILPLEYDKHGRRGAVFGNAPSYVASLCTVDDPAGADVGPQPAPVLGAPRLTGAGLPRPPFTPFRFSPSSSDAADAARVLSHS